MHDEQPRSLTRAELLLRGAALLSAIGPLGRLAGGSTALAAPPPHVAPTVVSRDEPLASRRALSTLTRELPRARRRASRFSGRTGAATARCGSGREARMAGGASGRPSTSTSCPTRRARNAAPRVAPGHPRVGRGRRRRQYRTERLGRRASGHTSSGARRSSARGCSALRRRRRSFPGPAGAPMSRSSRERRGTRRACASPSFTTPRDSCRRRPPIRPPSSAASRPTTSRATAGMTSATTSSSTRSVRSSKAGRAGSIETSSARMRSATTPARSVWRCSGTTRTSP